MKRCALGCSGALLAGVALAFGPLLDAGVAVDLGQGLLETATKSGVPTIGHTKADMTMNVYAKMVEADPDEMMAAFEL